MTVRGCQCLKLSLKLSPLKIFKLKLFVVHFHVHGFSSDIVVLYELQ